MRVGKFVLCVCALGAASAQEEIEGAVSKHDSNQKPLYMRSAAKPQVADEPYSPHVFMEGDLLYWVSEASGLDLNFGSGTNTHTTVGGVTTTYSDETDTDPSFQWNVGYRVALGWIVNPQWEMDGVWTAFQSFGDWKVKLNQIDLATHYSACIDSIRLEPSIGLRGTSIEQKLSSQVITDVVFPGTGTGTDSRTFQDKQQFYGLGPLFGLNSNYSVADGFSFYGNFAFGLLYGTYHLHFNDTEVTTPPASASQIFSKIKKNMQAFDFDIDLALGMQWEILLGKKCCMTTKLGVENHQYFNQSRLGHTFGNVSFSGGIFSLALAF